MRFHRLTLAASLAAIGLFALAAAGCSRSDGVDGLGTSAGVGSVLCPTQTQGRTEGDDGCVKPPPEAQSQGRTN